MAGRAFNAAIRIVPRRSPLFGHCVLLLHGFLVVLELLAFAGEAYAWVLGAATLLHYLQFSRELALTETLAASVLLDESGHWWIQFAGGERVAATLASRRLVTTHLLVLPLRAAVGDTRLRLILLSDNLPADDFRRLRVRLLWQATAGTAS